MVTKNENGSMRIEGHVEFLGLKKKRRYFVATVPYKYARELVESRYFDGKTGHGEQRTLNDSHVRSLAKEFENDNFTPTPWSAAVPKPLLELAEINERSGKITLDIPPEKHLVLTDGGHRKAALWRLREIAMNKEDDEMVKLIDEQPITIVAHLDGDTKIDFVNLQSGKNVDKNHLLSLRIRKGLMKSDEEATRFKLAYEVAKLLHDKKSETWMSGNITFDTKAVRLPIPLTSIMSRNSSDIGTSLVGGAKICEHYECDEEFLVNCYKVSYDTLEQKAVELLGPQKVLASIDNGGRKGGFGLHIGMGNMLAYRCCLLGQDEPSEHDLKQLVKAAKATLNVEQTGNLGADAKRALLGEFAKVFFSDLVKSKDIEMAFHEGLPVGLIQILSASTFDVSPLPKETAEAAVEVAE